MMKTLAIFSAACLAFCSVSAHATPKAAEHENAPVTSGADVARPKISAKPAKPQVTGKKRAEAKKTRHDSKSTKKAVTKK
jgi:hypothetical protein